MIHDMISETKRQHSSGTWPASSHQLGVSLTQGNDWDDADLWQLWRTSEAEWHHGGRQWRPGQESRGCGASLIQQPRVARPGESQCQDTTQITETSSVTVWSHGLHEEEEVSWCEWGGGGGAESGGGHREEEEAGDVRECEGVPLQQETGPHLCTESGERRTLRDLREVTQPAFYVSKGL